MPNLTAEILCLTSIPGTSSGRPLIVPVNVNAHNRRALLAIEKVRPASERSKKRLPLGAEPDSASRFLGRSGRYHVAKSSSSSAAELSSAIAV